MADVAADDADERAARTTFVVVGAGYTGTEVAAQGVLFTDALHPAPGDLAGRPRWLLLDTADRVLPQLDARLARAADRVLRRARRRGPARDQRQGGHRGRRAPERRRVRADPVADLVRRAFGPTRWSASLGLPIEAGPAGGRRVPHRAGPTRTCTPAATRPRCPT